MNEKVLAVSDSIESVALKLTMDIASQENLYNKGNEYRAELLDLYSECLEAVDGRRDRK